MNVRGFYRAVKVPEYTAPNDTIHLKILYPAKPTGSEAEQNLGRVEVFRLRSAQVDPELAPFPVAIFMSGFNCESYCYQWLGRHLTERGIVTILSNFVAEDIPGLLGLTPGVSVTAGYPDTYGTQPTSSILPALFVELENLQANSLLAGKLDLQKIILSGHSAGGRLALENANPNFYPQVVAAFAYGAHTAGATMFGYAPETILPLSGSVPMLLMGGTQDGVIASSCGRYGMRDSSSTQSIVRTFEEGISRSQKDTFLMLLEGANHFTIANPMDTVTARGFLDFPATQSESALRHIIAQAMVLFVEACVREDSMGFYRLSEFLDSNSSLLALVKQK
jgi:hypothetical protein